MLWNEWWCFYVIYYLIHFFCVLNIGEKRKFEEVTSDVIMVMRTTLSKKEFASALGMKDGDVFVHKMFNIVDKDGDGRISFQEFLDTIVLFSKGRTDDKLRYKYVWCFVYVL